MAFAGGSSIDPLPPDQAPLWASFIIVQEDYQVAIAALLVYDASKSFLLVHYPTNNADKSNSHYNR